MRRKLRTFRRWADEGRITRDEAANSYQSWRGHAMRCNSRKAMRKLDSYFSELFKTEERECSK